MSHYYRVTFYWFKDDMKKRIFLFLSAALEEAGGGFDRRRVTQALDGAGWLVEKDADRLTHKVRTPGGLRNLYHIRLPEDTL